MSHDKRYESKDELAPANDEEDRLLLGALAYVSELYREVASVNGEPMLGVQNQVIEFILAEPELRETVLRWIKAEPMDGVVTEMGDTLPRAEGYWRIRHKLEALLGPDPHVFDTPGSPVMRPEAKEAARKDSDKT